MHAVPALRTFRLWAPMRPDQLQGWSWTNVFKQQDALRVCAGSLICRAQDEAVSFAHGAANWGQQLRKGTRVDATIALHALLVQRLQNSQIHDEVEVSTFGKRFNGVRGL
eukprot:6208479-Pleurochrysis_carterae.AAC.2